MMSLNHVTEPYKDVTEPHKDVTEPYKDVNEPCKDVLPYLSVNSLDTQSYKRLF